MIRGKHHVLRFFKRLFITMFIFFIIFFVLSLSPKMAVRLRIYFDLQPVTSITCKPYYDKDSSKNYKSIIYSIPSKDVYDMEPTDTTISMFKLHKYGIIYFATDETNEC